jgi:hypothetical protein
MELAVLFSILAIANVAALRFGVDSRDGNDWIQHPRP